MMQFTADQIASMVGGTVEGNPQAVVSTVAKIEEGQKGSISFLSNPKYTHYIYTTNASIVLVGRDFKAEHPISATLIRVDDPYATVAMLMQMAAKMLTPDLKGVESQAYIADDVNVDDSCYVGAFAYISKGAKIGRNVKIYPRCFVGMNVEIGDNTILYPGVTVYHHCKVGADCVLHAGVVIGADGFGFAPVDGHYNKIPQLGNVVIGNNVEIGANTCIDRATMGSTVIEDGVKLDNLIQVAHNCHIGSNTVMASQVGVAGSTKIGSHCMIGGQVGFAGHITIGNGVQVGAQSGIPRDIPDGKILMGYPAVDAGQFARQAAAIARLPEMMKTISALQKKIAELEKK